ncbi:hypothetical protein [Streptomyces sp. STCH 565 A]|nr:hypothetical protein [Streptomyces sp. STCH 565 A]
MTALDWLLWGSSIWSVWLLFVLLDAPTLLANLADRYRHGSTR